MTKRHRQLLAQKADLEHKRSELAKEGHAIGDMAEAERRHLTDGEKQRRDQILAELDGLKGELEATAGEIEAEARLEAHERETIARSGASPGDTTRQISSAHEFSGLGEFLQAIAVAADSRIAASFGSKAAVLRAKLDAYQAAATGMSVGVPSDGGYLVRKDWSTAMLDRAREAAVLLPRTRSVPLGGDFDSLEYPYIDETSRATGSRFGGVQIFRVAEAATVNAKAPKIGKGELKLEELMGLAYATSRLLRDGTALQGILGDSFASEFAFVIDDEIIWGDGVAKCLGFKSSAVYIEQAKEASQAADTVVAGNVLKMYARMPSRLKAGAVWLVHPDVMSQLPQMVIGDMPVWLPPGQLTQVPGGLLLGKPVLEVEQCNELGKSGDIVLANLNEYVTITKAGEGLVADESMHVRFLNNEMVFRWTYRINGQPTWKTALTPYKGASTLSPFIGLADRD